MSSSLFLQQYLACLLYIATDIYSVGYSGQVPLYQTSTAVIKKERIILYIYINPSARS